MQSHYEINVSHNGTHLFATAPRSCVTEDKARKVWGELSRRFPESEGYTVGVTFADCTYRVLDFARKRRAKV